MERTQILVYRGEGVSTHYLRHTLRFLRQYMGENELKIQRVDGEFLLYDPLWEDYTRLLVFPGGVDRPYHNKLHGLGTARIAEYVREGGRFLGICAGAYFGAKMVYFDEPDGPPLREARDLGFFPGLAIGPAYGKGFSYTSPSGVQVTPQMFTGFGQGWALFNGGCVFEGAEDYPEVYVEARYVDLPRQPASIISRYIGKGMVVLSGPHIEYLPDHCQLTQDNVKKVREFLREQSETLHCYCSNLLIRLLQPTL
ncbi:BPL-N domain-containing protein [Candidatus Chlamydia sanziniae]|uniref:Biotin-protein ligase n=1 Tax=Candidatus Chlamydia sanziniae TaxID=1806891 RepID=A0A1A9HV84_9CHLA|nr:BPL-N domain-containing protein [Candidatus Chlamydia sanziniae]ANH78910.1 Biotin-protein ligase [Candidatus Chlamydia sanziniae]